MHPCPAPAPPSSPSAAADNSPLRRMGVNRTPCPPHPGRKETAHLFLARNLLGVSRPGFWEASRPSPREPSLLVLGEPSLPGVFRARRAEKSLTCTFAEQSTVLKGPNEGPSSTKMAYFDPKGPFCGPLSTPGGCFGQINSLRPGFLRSDCASAGLWGGPGGLAGPGKPARARGRIAGPR